MFGVLVDVSGSMKSAFALDGSHQANVERTHAILTTIMSIIKQEVYHHKRQESIFASAFGMNRLTETCDLLFLLRHSDLLVDAESSGGYEKLIDMAAQCGKPHVAPWIRDHLSESEAGILYSVLRSDPSRLRELIQLIPSQGKMTAVAVARYTPVGFFIPSERNMVHDSDALKQARAIIGERMNVLKEMDRPKPRPLREVSIMLDELLQPAASATAQSSSATAQSSSLHDKISELIKPIRPYIFGGTPMCKALNDADAVFKGTTANPKVLFILSDGLSTDGDPCPLAQKLRESGVTIVTCYLTSDEVPNPRCLLDSATTLKESGRLTLFKMSSTMRNTDAPITYLVDANWELPSSGESRLFIQANSLDVINEFCELVVSQMTNNSCDALVHFLEKVPLATYINQSNADFKPKEQEGGTCYANAISAVFHLAMHRIVGREGGLPDFYELRECIINEYGDKGANTEKVLEKVCPKYRLNYREVNEEEARQAINRRRPVVTKFWLFDQQWDRFSEFYRKTPTKILRGSDLKCTGSLTTPGGHAVVLIRCDPHCLTFMNSWSTNWGDGGFFRVKDHTVLNDTRFFDVYWTLNDLKPSERRAYERKCAERAQTLLHTFPSIEGLLHKCPKCNRKSNVREFTGDIVEAECPKCHNKFKPTNRGIMQSLYLRNVE